MFARRNRVLVGAAVLLAGALVVGTLGTIIGFVRAVDAREVAEENESFATMWSMRAVDTESSLLLVKG